METENTVSIWIGNFDTKLELDEFITLKYDIEKEVFETSFTNLFDMLKGASYDNIIVKNLEQKGIKANIAPNNTLILIYNYQFDSNVPQTSNTEFVATVRYK